MTYCPIGTTHYQPSTYYNTVPDEFEDEKQPPSVTKIRTSTPGIPILQPIFDSNEIRRDISTDSFGKDGRGYSFVNATDMIGHPNKA